MTFNVTVDRGRSLMRSMIIDQFSRLRLQEKEFPEQLTPSRSSRQSILDQQLKVEASSPKVKQDELIQYLMRKNAHNLRIYEELNRVHVEIFNRMNGFDQNIHEIFEHNASGIHRLKIKLNSKFDEILTQLENMQKPKKTNISPLNQQQDRPLNFLAPQHKSEYAYRGRHQNEKF